MKLEIITAICLIMFSFLYAYYSSKYIAILMMLANLGFIIPPTITTIILRSKYSIIIFYFSIILWASASAGFIFFDTHSSRNYSAAIKLIETNKLLSIALLFIAIFAGILELNEKSCASKINYKAPSEKFAWMCSFYFMLICFTGFSFIVLNTDRTYFRSSHEWFKQLLYYTNNGAFIFLLLGFTLTEPIERILQSIFRSWKNN